MTDYKPMLPQNGDKSVITKPNFIFEPLIDGTRVFICKEGEYLQFINRKGEDIAFRYPELWDAYNRINADSCILDAEIVVLNNRGITDPVLLQQREQLEKKQVINAEAKKHPASLFIFDILNIDNIDLSDVPLERRRARLKGVVKESPSIVILLFSESGSELWKRINELNFDGVIAKDIRSNYEQKRSFKWLKIKTVETANMLVAGYAKEKLKADAKEKVKGKESEEKGKEKETEEQISLILAAYDPGKHLIYSGRAYPHKIDEEIEKKLKKLKTRQSVFGPEEEKRITAEIKKQNNDNQRKGRIFWLMPELIAKIQRPEMRFVRFRFDKEPEDCVI